MFNIAGFVVDFIIIALLVIFGIIGLKKGLFKSLLSLFSWSVCIVVACLTAKYVAGWIDKLYDFSSLIGNKIADSLTKTNEFFTQPISAYADGGSSSLISALNNLEMNGLLKQVIKIIFSKGSVDMSSSNTIGSVVGYKLGNICMIVITAILIFIFLKITLFLLSKFFKNLEQIKLIGGLNKTLGLILGLLRAGLIVVTINFVLVALTLIPAVDKTITPIINKNTYIERFVFNQTDKIFEEYVLEGDILSNLTKTK